MNSLSSNPVPSAAQRDQDTVHIAFCVDDRYFRCMGATIASLLVNNPRRRFSFHVLATQVNEDNRRRFAALGQQPGVATQLHVLDAALFSRFEHYTKSTYYSSAIFARLVIADVLKSVTDRVLYLDADILCVGSLDALLALDQQDTIAAVVPDAEATTRRRVEALKLKHGRYFNSGMLYINIANWIAEGITQQIIDVLLKEWEDFRFPDQDALNLVLDGRALYVDIRWNYLYGLVGDLESRRTALAIPEGAASLIHFAGSVKPWGVWSGHDAVALFQRYHAESAWSDLPLDLAPENHKELRMHSRFQWARGQYVDSLRWYWRYLMARRRLHR